MREEEKEYELLTAEYSECRLTKESSNLKLYIIIFVPLLFLWFLEQAKCFKWNGEMAPFVMFNVTLV